MKNKISMVDITQKQESYRCAVSVGKIFFSKEVYEKIKSGKISKGNPITVAQIAGVLAAKNVVHTIPLTHPINITHCDIQVSLRTKNSKFFIEVTSTVKTSGKTGPDIESIFATMVSLLTIYDMIKPLDPSAIISDIKLISKTGGKTNYFRD